jgi:hypothetical protein
MHGHVVLPIRVIFVLFMDHGVRSRRKVTVTAYGEQLLSQVGSSSLASRYVIGRNDTCLIGQTEYMLPPAETPILGSRNLQLERLNPEA